MKVLIIVILCILTLLATQVVNDDIILDSKQISDTIHSDLITVEVECIEKRESKHFFIHPNSTKEALHFIMPQYQKMKTASLFYVNQKKYIL